MYFTLNGWKLFISLNKYYFPYNSFLYAIACDQTLIIKLWQINVIEMIRIMCYTELEIENIIFCLDYDPGKILYP